MLVVVKKGRESEVERIFDEMWPTAPASARKQLLEHPDYYRLREELISFLEECDHA